MSMLRICLGVWLLAGVVGRAAELEPEAGFVSLFNGKLEEALKVPATGPIGVEGDRGRMEYRRIRIKELP